MSVKTIDDLPWALVQVLTHWKNLDAQVAPGEITLSGNYGRTEMLRDLEALNGLSDEILDRVNKHKAMAGGLIAHRTDLKEFLRSFVFSVRGLLMDTTFIEQLPRLPDLHAHQGPFMHPMETAIQVWRKINTNPPAGFAAPLVLASGLNLAKFEAKVNEAKAVFEHRARLIAEEREIRKRRERLATQLRNRAIQYHHIVSGSFPAGSEEVRTLPRLWPPTVRKKKVPVANSSGV
jgi:hypothetical protein